MNKDKLNLYMRILTFPLTNLFFEEGQDILEKKAQIYYNLHKNSFEVFSVREEEKKEYEKINKDIIKICSHEFQRAKRIDDILTSLELFYPMDKMSECFNKSHHDEPYCIEQYYLNRIFDTAQAFLSLRNGMVSIRITEEKSYEYLKEGPEEDLFLENLKGFNKVELWNVLTRLVSEDIYIAAFYVLCGIDDERALYNQKSRIKLSDTLLDNVLQKGIAETHVHFHVSSSFEVSWADATYPNSNNFKKNKSSSFFSMIFRVLAAQFLISYKKNNKINFENFLNKYLKQKKQKKNLDYIVIKALIEDKINLLKEYDILNFMDTYRHNVPERTNDFLEETIFQNKKYLRVSYEFLLLFYILHYLKEKAEKKEPDKLFLKMFFRYIREKNNYYKKITQSHTIEGLDEFQLYFREASDSLIQSSIKSRILHILMSQSQNYYVKKFEMRLTPYVTEEWKENEYILKKEIKEDILRNIHIFAELYLEYIELIESYFPNKEIDKLFSKNKIACATPGIVFHFLKREIIDDTVGKFCWLTKKDSSLFHSDCILMWQKKRLETAKVLNELIMKVPLLSEYIVGIDAASNENAVEPWIFAPIFRACRSTDDITSYVYDNENIPHKVNNICFTYHIGEEFRHILSGLRHVDEVLEHFDYCAGDRLGHAIVLGVDVEYWITQNEVVAIPIGEYLDNLLWLWGVLRIDTKHLNIIEDNLELEIMEYAQKIYPDISGLTPFLLYQAYQRKFKYVGENFFKHMEDNYITKNSKEVSQVGGQFCIFNNNNNTVWTIDKLLCTMFCPIYQNRYKKPIFVNVRKDHKKLFQEIQNMLLEKVEKMGVYVETNPTSNTTIGEIESLMKHPIFHLNNYGLTSETVNQVMVTINSDDPLVFNTNVENEIAYIYHALIHYGYKRENVLKWIDKIRQYGIDSSFIKQIKLPTQLNK